MSDRVTYNGESQEQCRNACENMGEDNLNRFCVCVLLQTCDGVQAFVWVNVKRAPKVELNPMFPGEALDHLFPPLTACSMLTTSLLYLQNIRALTKTTVTPCVKAERFLDKPRNGWTLDPFFRLESSPPAHAKYYFSYAMLRDGWHSSVHTFRARLHILRGSSLSKLCTAHKKKAQNIQKPDKERIIL